METDIPTESITRSVITLSFATFSAISGTFACFYKPDFSRTVGKIACLYFSLDSYGLDLQYIIHHIFGFLMSTILGFSREITQPLRFIYIFTTLEYSTVLLDIYHINKSQIVKYLFAGTFFYYRLYGYTRWLLFEYPEYSREYDVICTDHKYYKTDSCKTIMYSGSGIIGLLNVYWGYLIAKKIYGKFKRYIKNN